MNTSWSIQLKEQGKRICVLVGLDGGVPVIVQGYGSILLSPDRCESPGKKGGNTKRFRPFASEKIICRRTFLFSSQDKIMCKRTNSTRRLADG